jgi:hypothetical protein
MNDSRQDIVPEVLARLRAFIDEHRAKAKPKFTELDKHRAYICELLDSNEVPNAILGAVRKQFNLSVSADTFYRYVAYLRPRHKKTKRLPTTKPIIPMREPASKAPPTSTPTPALPAAGRPRGPRIAPKDI